MESSSVDDPRERKQGSFNIYQYDAQLALAFQTDCENLFDKFSKLQSYHFSDFAKLWKETCFISIFEGQENILTLEVFTENCFFVVKKFLFSSDLYIQLGAVYVLYALYYKQPIRQWVKIRLTLVEADKLNEIIDFHREFKRWEIVFIVSKMRLDGAFHYSALVQALGLDAKFAKRFDLASEEINRRNPAERSPLEKFKDMMNNDPLLKDIEETEKEYQNLVTKYKERCRELYIFPSTISTELKEAYSRVLEDYSSDKNEETSRLTEIKTRAMSNKNATYRAESAIITPMD